MIAPRATPAVGCTGPHGVLVCARVRRLCLSTFVLPLVALLLAGAAPLRAETVRVRPQVRDGHVLVSFFLDQGFTDDVRAVVRSGLRTTFTYTVDLRLKVPAWIDRSVATAVVATTVEYDNLTRRHTITRTIDGRTQESRVVDDEAIVRQMMTQFDRLPLFRTGVLQEHRDYYIVVRAEARPRGGAVLWPWGGAVSGFAPFTFIP
jgi:hypothetical protein